MLPPHQPARRRKKTESVVQRPSHVALDGRGTCRADLSPLGKLRRVKPAPRVLGCGTRASPVASARKRKISC